MVSDKNKEKYPLALTGRIVVSGSLAYDQIMNFPGEFGDHILPDQVHNLNLSFFLNDLRQSDGGTAGNIAYNLALLGERPLVFGVAGGDFAPYSVRLTKVGADLSRIKIIFAARTAGAYLITDQRDNQIAAFYPGPRVKNYVVSAVQSLKNIKLAIISADDKERMLAYATAYRRRNIPYIFDVGQALIAFSPSELRLALKGAYIFIGNDYEVKLAADKLKLSLAAFRKIAAITVVTKGAHGSEVYQGNKKIIVKAARPKNSSDPTGAGDAYRAGFIKGLLFGYNLKTCAQMGAVAAVYTVEKFGTQTHYFSWAQFKRRYQMNFGSLG